MKARIPAQFEQATDFFLLIPEEGSLRLNAVGEVRADEEVPRRPSSINDRVTQVLATVPDHFQIGSWHGNEAPP